MTEQEWQEWHNYYILTSSAKRWQEIEKNLNSFKSFIDAQVHEKRYFCEISAIHGTVEQNAYDEAEFEKIKAIQTALIQLEMILSQ